MKGPPMLLEPVQRSISSWILLEQFSSTFVNLGQCRMVARVMAGLPEM